MKRSPENTIEIPTITADGFLHIDRCCDIFALSKETLKGWCRQGKIRYSKPAHKTILIHVDSLREFILKGVREPIRRNR